MLCFRFVLVVPPNPYPLGSEKFPAKTSRCNFCFFRNFPVWEDWYSQFSFFETSQCVKFLVTHAFLFLNFPFFSHFPFFSGSFTANLSFFVFGTQLTHKFPDFFEVVIFFATLNTLLSAKLHGLNSQETSRFNFSQNFPL